jgi:hypothetical protein
MRLASCMCVASGKWYEVQRRRAELTSATPSQQLRDGCSLLRSIRKQHVQTPLRYSKISTEQEYVTRLRSFPSEIHRDLEFYTEDEAVALNKRYRDESDEEEVRWNKQFGRTHSLSEKQTGMLAELQSFRTAGVAAITPPKTEQDDGDGDGGSDDAENPPAKRSCNATKVEEGSLTSL